MQAGEPLTIKGDAYWYDEEFFGAIWRFNGSVYEMVVDYEYSNGDMGIRYNGSRGDAMIPIGRDTI